MKIVAPNNITNLDELDIEQTVYEPFASILIEFIDDVSKNILKDNAFKEFPELLALAFWMRKAHIRKLKNYFLDKSQDKFLLGKGVVFHLAPSNVDTIFVYSWFISLLVGNSNIIRISDKENTQTDMLLNSITAVLNLKKYKKLRKRVAIIRYGHEDKITKLLSSICDCRVIWGGDTTVQHIRSIPIKPSATELIFPDKFSFSIIKASEFIELSNFDKFFENFYKDAYSFNQMACSSIKLVAWVGEENIIQESKILFWNNLNSYLNKRIPEDIQGAEIINKLIAEASLAITNNACIKNHKNPYINVIELESLEFADGLYHSGAGLFYEIEVGDLNEIYKFITRKHQTIAQFGFSKDELKDSIKLNMPNGIDRIVPVGQALDFSNIWDGNDLLLSFCREIDIK